MASKTREQLLTEIETLIRPGTADGAKITALDLRAAFTTLVDELLARTTEQQSSSSLEFVFAPDFSNEIRATIGGHQAGSYRLAATQNATAVAFAVNGTAALPPLSLQSGDEVAVTVTRLTPASGAVVTLESTPASLGPESPVDTLEG